MVREAKSYSLVDWLVASDYHRKTCLLHSLIRHPITGCSILWDWTVMPIEVSNLFQILISYLFVLINMISTVQAYLDTQNKFISIYHAANELWSDYCAAEFGRKLRHMLEIEQWNDLNTTAVLWQSKHAVSDVVLCLHLFHPN
jgi:hypothetical protein